MRIILIILLGFSHCASISLRNSTLPNTDSPKSFPTDHPNPYWILSEITYDIKGRPVKDYASRDTTVVMAFKNHQMNWYFLRQNKFLCPVDQAFAIGKLNYSALLATKKCQEHLMQIVSYDFDSLDNLVIETSDHELIGYFVDNAASVQKIDFLFVRKSIDYLKNILQNKINSATNSELFKTFEVNP